MTSKENQPRKKRGRPPAFDDEWYRVCKGLAPNTRTRRGIVNQLYSYEGLKIIRDMPGMEYIFNEKTETIKVCILTELGRLNDEQAAREAATFICEREAEGDHRTAHEWAAIVRRLRLNEGE